MFDLFLLYFSSYSLKISFCLFFIFKYLSENENNRQALKSLICKRSVTSVTVYLKKIVKCGFSPDETRTFLTVRIQIGSFLLSECRIVRPETRRLKHNRLHSMFSSHHHLWHHSLQPEWGKLKRATSLHLCRCVLQHPAWPFPVTVLD